MKKSEFFIALFLFLVIVGVFFYKSILLGFTPFPGDLLVSEYAPWKTYSYLGYVAGSYPNKAQYFDVLRQLYPWRDFAFSTITLGQLPLWNPHNFSGTPLLANFQSAVFYPLNIVFFFLPFIKGWSFLVFLQSFLTGFFTYLYCRNINLSKLASFLSAVSFTFCSFLTVWLEYNTIGHVVLYLPLSLFCIESLLKKRTRALALVFVLSLAFAMTAGHPQLFLYQFSFLVVYTIVRIFMLHAQKKALLLFFLFLFAVGIGLSAVQWVVGLELVSYSARAPLGYEFTMQKVLIQPFQLIMLFVPDFFGNPATRNYWIADTYVGKMISIGIIPLLFLPFAFLRKEKKLPFLFGTIALVIALLTTANPITGLLYGISLPLFTSSSPTLGIFIFCFSLAILAGLGVDVVREEKRFPVVLKVLSFYIFLFLLFWMGLFLAKQMHQEFAMHATQAIKNLLYGTGILIVGIFLLALGSYKKKFMVAVLVLLIFIQTADAFRSFQRFNPFVPEELVYPQAPVLEELRKIAGNKRFIGYGSGTIEANFATEENVFSPEGYDPLYPKQYGQFILSAKNGKLPSSFTTQDRSDAVVSRAQTFKELIENPYRKKILDSLGVSYILSRQEDLVSVPFGYKIVYEQKGWKIVKNESAAKRAFLTTNYKIAETNSEFEKAFFDTNFDVKDTIILEKKVAVSSQDKPGIIRSETFEKNSLLFRVKNDSNNLLFVSDTWYPGWKAFIDGKEAEILQANYAFRAVMVPQGEHSVVFRYEPESFTIGMIISVVSACFLSLFLLFYKRIV